MKKLFLIIAMCAVPFLLSSGTSGSQNTTDAETTSQVIVNPMSLVVYQTPAPGGGCYANMVITTEYAATVDITFSIAYYDPTCSYVSYDGVAIMRAGTNYASCNVGPANPQDTWIYNQTPDPAYQFTMTDATMWVPEM